MTAKGKITASKVEVGDRIIVRVWFDDEGHEHVDQSDTKTGQGVQVDRVLAKTFRGPQDRYERRGKYVIETTIGVFEADGIQTLWLAPEDPAGIKRAHAEALAEDAHRAADRKEFADQYQASGQMDERHAEALAENTARELAEHEKLTRELGHAEALEEDADRTARDEQEDECGLCGGPLASDGACANDECGDDLEDLTLDSQAGKVDNMNNEEKNENVTGSTVVRLLERIWERIREDHADLPEVVIVTGSGLTGGASKWGHFRADGWTARNDRDLRNGHAATTSYRMHELFLAGEALAKGATQVLQTMLHEGAHTLARIRDLKDTSRQGRWHNATFRKLAGEMGLEHKGASADSSHGFSFVTLTQPTKDRYADLLEELDREIKLSCHLPVWLGGNTEDGDEAEGGEKITGKPAGETKVNSGNVKATCGCDEPLIIRLSRKVLDLKVVRCDVCEERFTEAL